jgi:hypothetical protein
MGFDVSSDVMTSQIRLEPDKNSLVLATWDVAFDSDGTDGELILTLEYTDLDDIAALRGWMDIKRDSGGSPLPVFARPLEVEFIRAVTA